MIVADSDVLVDFLRGAEPAAARVAVELETTSFGTTAVNAFELRSGARTERQIRAVDELLGALTILPFGSREAQCAAKLRLDLERRGEGIGMADYLIAGACLARDAVLLTKNRKHFERVPGLKLGHLQLDEIVR